MVEDYNASVCGHEPEIVVFDGEHWQIVCSCSWECAYMDDEEAAWETFNDHIFDDVRTAIVRMRDRVPVTNLV